MRDLEARIEEAAALLRGADPLVAFTGAGISAESGIPTFRGGDGLWRGVDPAVVASVEGLEAHPEACWEFHRELRRTARRARPNPAHEALARREVQGGDCLVVTQNVDRLHRRAGSRRVIELHGDLFRDRCHVCGAAWEAQPESDEESGVPRCPRCGGIVRPDVVLFGEPVRRIEEAVRAARRCAVLLAVGTSGVVQPAASIPFVAADAGAKVIVVNRDRTPLDEAADVVLLGPAGELLPRLLG